MEHVLTDEELGQYVWDIIVGNEAGTITSIEPEEIGRLLRECIEYKAAFALIPVTKLQSLEIHAQQGGALFAMLGGVVNLMREKDDSAVNEQRIAQRIAWIIDAMVNDWLNDEAALSRSLGTDIIAALTAAGIALVDAAELEALRQPMTLSGADREALARDICLIYDELDSGDPPPEGWCDKMHPQGWPYLLVDRLLTRWHIVRRCGPIRNQGEISVDAALSLIAGGVTDD